MRKTILIGVAVAVMTGCSGEQTKQEALEQNQVDTLTSIIVDSIAPVV